MNRALYIVDNCGTERIIRESDVLIDVDKEIRKHDIISDDITVNKNHDLHVCNPNPLGIYYQQGFHYPMGTYACGTVLGNNCASFPENHGAQIKNMYEEILRLHKEIQKKAIDMNVNTDNDVNGFIGGNASNNVCGYNGGNVNTIGVCCVNHDIRGCCATINPEKT